MVYVGLVWTAHRVAHHTGSALPDVIGHRRDHGGLDDVLGIRLDALSS